MKVRERGRGFLNLGFDVTFRSRSRSRSRRLGSGRSSVSNSISGTVMVMVMVMVAMLRLRSARVLVHPDVEEAGSVGGQVVYLAVCSKIRLGQHPLAEAVAATDGSDGDGGRILADAGRGDLEPHDGGGAVVAEGGLWVLREEGLKVRVEQNLVQEHPVVGRRRKVEPALEAVGQRLHHFVAQVSGASSVVRDRESRHANARLVGRRRSSGTHMLGCRWRSSHLFLSLSLL